MIYRSGGGARDLPPWGHPSAPPSKLQYLEFFIAATAHVLKAEQRSLRLPMGQTMMPIPHIRPQVE